MPVKSETFSVRLPNDVKHQVDELARLTNRSRSLIVKEAVECYMRQMESNFKEAENFDWTAYPDLDKKIEVARQQTKEGKTILADDSFFESAREAIRSKYL